MCLDLGEEEYTKGRPHPMIDPAARREILREQAFGADVAAVLLDVVLGYGSHPDPAGEIAGTCADIVAAGAAVVCYVLGAAPTSRDSTGSGPDSSRRARSSPRARRRRPGPRPRSRGDASPAVRP